MRLIIEGDEAQIATVMEAMKTAKTLIEERDALRAREKLFIADRRARGLPDHIKPPLGLPPNFEFRECASCAAKPGTPTLCTDCLRRREAFG